MRGNTVCGGLAIYPQAMGMTRLELVERLVGSHHLRWIPVVRMKLAMKK